MSVLTTTPLKSAPSAAAGVAITAATAPTWGAWVEVIAATAAPIAIAGVALTGGTYSAVWWELDIGTGAAAAETVITTIRVSAGGEGFPSLYMIPNPVDNVAASTRLAARLRSSTASATMVVSLSVLEQPL